MKGIYRSFLVISLALAASNTNAQYNEYFSDVNLGGAMKFHNVTLQNEFGENEIYKQDFLGAEIGGTYHYNPHLRAGLRFFYSPGNQFDLNSVVVDGDFGYQLKADALDISFFVRGGSNMYRTFSVFADLGFVYKQVRYENIGDLIVFEDPVSGDIGAFVAGFGTNLRITNGFHWEIFRVNYEFVSGNMVFQQGSADFWTAGYEEQSIEWKGIFTFSTSFKANLVRKKY